MAKDTTKYPKEVYGQIEGKSESGNDSEAYMAYYEDKESPEDGEIAVYEFKKVVKKKTRTTISFK